METKRQNLRTATLHFTFSHFADAFIQSDLQTLKKYLVYSEIRFQRKLMKVLSMIVAETGSLTNERIQ